MAPTNTQIMVDGRWLSLTCLYGDVEMSTCWPGGSDELTWTLGTKPAQAFRGGELVEGVYGGVNVFAGTLLEPDPSQDDQMTAQGLWRLGDNFSAIGAAGGASINVDVATTQAAIRGLPWTRPVSISTSTEIDISQGPVTVGVLMDTYADNNGVRWGVNPLGEVFAQADPGAPIYKTLPLDGSLGYALDDYASTLICRYLDSATSTFKTVTVTDTAAAAAHGAREAVVDLTGRGAISTARATAIGNNLLTLGRSTPQWTNSIELSYGELLTTGGTPVALEKVAAGQFVRVVGGAGLSSRQNGAGYVDMQIGKTSLSGGTLTLQPMQVATRSYQDFVTEALSKRKKKQAS